MIPLNLPPFDYKLKKAEGKLWIFDVIRKKYIVLIPEEWVRQHFVHYLIYHQQYPKALIRVEGGLNYNQLQKRSDIVVYDRAGLPWMIIECKSPDVPVTDKTVFQASTYNATLKAKYLIVTNGLRHLVARIDWQNGTTEWLDELPDYEGKEV
jgi:hypothetical protein